MRALPELRRYPRRPAIQPDRSRPSPDASDIAGTAAGSGAGIARLQNAKGVVLELQSNRVGTDAAVAISALEILMH